MSASGRPRSRRRRLRSGLERWIVVLIVLNIVVVAILLATVVFDQVNTTPAGHPAQTEPSPSASAELFAMGLAHIPTSSSCLLCHESGGSAGLKNIPAIGHELEGWRSCNVCHTNEVLGRTAPGHTGMPEAECLNCHKIAQPGPAITQPHSRLQDQFCLDCHGTFAHLPSSMASRKEYTCTLCHKPAVLPPPEYNHAINDRLGCRECHTSSEVGNMPIDHALRADDTCLLCHDIKRTPGSSQSPAAPRPSVPAPSPSPAGG